MKISLFYLPTYLPEVHGSEERLYQDILEEVEFADQAGFHSAWFAEHHFFAYGGAIPSVPMLGLAAALRTKRIRIGSGVALLPLNDPIRVAEEFALLDVLSGGRLEFGIGRAFQRAEYDAFNVSMTESRARFNEAHDIILKAWTQESFSYEGKYRTVQDLRVIPKPVQKPHPPISVACVLSQESFVWTGKQGYNLMYVPYVSTLEETRQRLGWYREALIQAGHDPSAREILLVYHFFMGETARHAQEYPRAFLLRYLQSAAESNRSDAYSQDYQSYAGIGKLFTAIDYDFMYPERVIFAEAEGCLRHLAELAALGVTHVSLVTNFGGIGHQEVMRSLERFATQVLPRLASGPAQAVATG